MPVHPNLLKSAKKLLQSPHRFANDELLQSLHTLSDDDLDKLDFGVIGLSDVGVILRYNKYETELANREKSSTIGKSFFKEVNWQRFIIFFCQFLPT